MRYLYLFIAALFFSQSALAETTSCEPIAKACLDAGFTRDVSANKEFWRDCMQPIVLGQSVQGVTVDAAMVKACRADKIVELQNELTSLKNAS